MADRTVRVRITGDASGLVAALGAAAAKTKAFATSLTAASRSAEWSKVSTGLLAVGATLTAVSTGAIKMAAEFDSAMSTVASTGSDAKANIGQLRDLALDMGAKTKYTSIEAAEGITALAKAGISTADIMGGALAGALALAATDNMSLDEAAESTAMTLTQFGLAGNQAGHVADVLAAGAGKAVGSVHDMSEALNNVGTVASQMGMSLEETTGTLALFAQNGIVGAEAGTQLKSMLLKLMNPSTEAKKTMDQLGISVYDGQGKFIGMAGVADQLRTKMSGLSQEQRDQAMATIFGSRAVLGASILYKSGAEGVQSWTQAVNDQGYAEQVAAEKMDNLKGDIEKLKSAFSNLAITAGGVAQGPLRTLVQSLTNVINELREHPAVAQAAVAAMGALGVAMLAVGTAMKGITAFAEFRAAMQALTGLSGAMETVKVAASNLVGAGRNLVTTWQAVPAATKGAALGYMALMTATIAAGQAISQNLVKADEISATMGQIASGSIGASAGFKAISDSAGAAYLSLGGPSGLAQAMRDAANPGPLNGLTEFVGHILGIKTTTETAKENVSALDQSLAKMVSGSPAQAAQAMQQLGNYVREAGLNADQTVSQFSSTADALQNEARAAGLAGLSNQDLAMWMRTGIKPAAVEAAEATMHTSDATQHMAESADSAGMSVENYASTLTSMSDAMKEAADIALTASEAQNKFLDAIDKAQTALNQNGATLDRNTEAGRSNWDALNGMAKAHLDLRDAMVAEGDSLDDINGKTSEGREAFINMAQAMGMSAEDANSLADRFGYSSMSVQDFDKAAQQAANSAGNLGDTAVNVGQNVQGTADNFENIGRKAGISAEEMYKFAQANQEGAAALDTTAQQALAEKAALEQAGASQEAINMVTQQGRDKIIQQAEAMGMGSEYANRLADAYGFTSMQLDMSASSVQNATTALENNAAVAGLDQGAVQGLAQSHQSGVVALQAYAQQSWDASNALDAGSISADQAANAQRNARQSFVDCAVQMGMTQDQANRLADAYGLIPGDVQTKVSAPGATQAKNEADADHQAVDAIPNQKHTNVSSSADTGPLHAVKSLLDSITSKTVTVSVYEQHFTSGVDRALHRAGGGYISGPGTTTSDSIPAWLSDGEYVIRAAAVRKYGRALFDQLNAGMTDRSFGRVPGFANGGPVVVARPITQATPVAQTVVNVQPAVITEGQLNRYLTRAVESVAARVLTGALVQGV